MKRKIFLLFMALAGGAAAQVRDIDVQDAWVRATVASQKATAVFMKLRSTDGAVLVAVSTPVAVTAEIHEVHKVGDIAKMRVAPGGVALLAGQTVELKPNGHHIMLQGLKQALPAGSTVALTLVVKDRQGQTHAHVLTVPVRRFQPVAYAGADAKGKR